MIRPKFTPRTWHSDDGKWTYRMDQHGITDITPGPKSRLWEWIAENYPEYERLTTKQPKIYPDDSQHDHWAF